MHGGPVSCAFGCLSMKQNLITLRNILSKFVHFFLKSFVQTPIGIVQGVDEMKNCQFCNSENLKKRGSYQTKTGKVQRYQCKACSKLQSKRTFSDNYRMRKQRMAKKIEAMYCERMSLRGIGRVLKVNRKTVEKYFLKMAKKAEIENLKNLDNREIVTSYIQFDSLETFEHTKRRPLGIHISIRAKTGELISAKVHKTDIRALAVSQTKIREWNSQTNQMQSLCEMLLETKKAFNRINTTIACDGYRPQINLTKKICDESFVNVSVLPENKKIDLTMLKLRNDISRLSRKSLCSTKKAERLQNHLDLYINYNNKNRIAS